MSLRLKLLSGYLLFVLALLVLGAWSAWRLSELGNGVRLILAENYDSVIAAQEMKESLERQDSGAVALLLGQRERALRQIREQRLRFDAAFDHAATNITEPGEQDLIAELRRERDGYYSLTDRWLVAEQSPGIQRETYFNKLEPAFHQLRGRCEALLQLNQQAMRGKSDRASNVARRSLLLTLTLATVLIGAGLVLAFFWADHVGRPVKALTQAAARIAGGDLSARAEVTTRDEIGLLAAEFNRMAERIRQLRHSDVGKLVVAQQTTAAALDLLAEPVVVTDELGRITNLTPAAESVFGDPEHSLGRSVEDAAPDKRLALAVIEALRSPTSGDTFGTALPIAVNGSSRAVRPRAKPMRDEDGRLLGAVLLLENVNSRQELDRFKSEFIATAAQALQEPLRNVQMDLHAVLDGATGELTDQQRDLLLACRDDGEKLERIMRGLVELTRLEAGECKLALKRINPAQTLGLIAEALRLQVEANDLTFKLEIPANLPVIQADAEMLKRILITLVINAIENTPRKGIITLSASAHEHHLLIAVADTGRGIPSEYLPQIFSRFVKIPGSPETGAGLSLALTRRMVESHGGQISVQSQPGQGTVFSLTLPINGAA
ncbi:MAG: HAMP domain-containing protein [Acidobacteria bacterium]|nr:HAMP domain-containing protein [Acidobacteriota bacterium]